MSTTYVQTRWYRAPELLLDCDEVTKQADMWSVGCIMAELFTGQVLFPGTSPIDQLDLIMNVLGSPNVKTFKAASRLAKDHLRKQKQREAVPLEQVLPGIEDPLAMDLLSKLLAFNPDQRIRASEAILHPYFAEYSEE
jgi:serine/threonine protein kinase